MVGTSARVVSTFACTTLCIAYLLLAGCGGAGDAISSFTGGTSSDDKKEIPSTVHASAAATSPDTPQPTAVAARAPAAANLQGPAPAAKGAETTAPATVDGRQVLREKRMTYRAGRTRDPFRSLVVGAQARSDLVDLSVVTLVGVVTGKDAFCVVEDAEGTSFILRKGDRVKNGRVVSIGEGKMTASQTVLGYTTTVQLKLDIEKDGSHG